MLFRAFFSSYEFTNPDGLEVGAVLMVCRQVQGMLSRHLPERVAVVFDAGHRTFRHEIDTDYKGHRDPPPSTLLPQFDLVQAALVQLGMACFCVRGFEADDLMATLAEHARQQGYTSRLWSADKDLYQLVCDTSPPTVQVDPRTSQRFTERVVHQKLGVMPWQVVDYMALVGDSTDNVAGVRGIGPKSAAALIGHFGPLDAIFARLDEVEALPVRGAKGLRRKLEAGQEDARKARQLVTLRRDVDVGLTQEQIFDVTRWRGTRGDSADRFFRHLGSTEPLSRLRRVVPHHAKQ